MKNKRLLGFLTSLLLFSGCASAELELTVDIYNKDIVSENHWTKKHIKHLELSKFAADKIASQRIEQAETFVELYKDYEDYYNLIENKKTTSESSTLENLRAQLSIYKNTLEQKRQTIHNLANQSAKNLKKIISPSHPPDVLSQLRNGLPSVNVFLLAEEINKSLKELGTKNFETNFEKNSEIIFNELAPYFSSKEFGKNFKIAKHPINIKKRLP